MWYEPVSGTDNMKRVRVTVAYLCGGLLEKFQFIKQIIVPEDVFCLRKACVFAESWCDLAFK
jgi:hypothetical protein